MNQLVSSSLSWRELGLALTMEADMYAPGECGGGRGGGGRLEGFYLGGGVSWRILLLPLWLWTCPLAPLPPCTYSHLYILPPHTVPPTHDFTLTCSHTRNPQAPRL